MKLFFSTLAVTTAYAAAFAPGKTMARQTFLQSAVETPTYTFTKSEEIFAEAQEVGCVLS